MCTRLRCTVEPRYGSVRVSCCNYAASGFCLFFFSSRRRHTRFDCDWSSDVCSSDLSEFFPSWRRCEAVGPGDCRPARSEEHTSELQSQSNLVCRLLLEKKKKQKDTQAERMDCIVVERFCQ